MITLVQTTSDKKSELEQIGQALVKSRQVACCQIDGPVSSTNHWEGDVEHTQEYRMTLKTTASHVPSIIETITKQHSYDLPEIIHYQVETTADYEAWVKAETS